MVHVKLQGKLRVNTNIINNDKPNYLKWPKLPPFSLYYGTNCGLSSHLGCRLPPWLIINKTMSLKGSLRDDLWQMGHSCNTYLIKFLIIKFFKLAYKNKPLSLTAYQAAKGRRDVVAFTMQQCSAFLTCIRVVTKNTNQSESSHAEFGDIVEWKWKVKSQFLEQ